MEFNLQTSNIEELYILEHCLSQDEARHRSVLGLISLAIVARQGRGETVSCYSDDTEHALHPDGYTWADSSSPVVPLQRTPSQVDTPVEGAA